MNVSSIARPSRSLTFAALIVAVCTPAQATAQSRLAAPVVERVIVVPIRTVPRVEFDRVLVGVQSRIRRYSDAPSSATQRFDTMRNDSVEQLDDGIRQVGRTEFDRTTLWRCTREGALSTAGGFGEASAGEAKEAYEIFGPAVTDCLRDGLGGPSDVNAIAKYLWNFIGGYAKQAGEVPYTETPAQRAVAQYLWLRATAEHMRQRTVDSARQAPPPSLSARIAPASVPSATPSAPSRWSALLRWLGAAAVGLAAIFVVQHWWRTP